MLTPEALDRDVISGISAGFALIFFGPLAVVATSFWVYCTLARRSVLRVARVLSFLWLVACVPATLLILMGYAFNSSRLTPLVTIPLWIATGLAALWLPVALRRLFRIQPL